MKLLIVSDAWQPQVNGVVRALDALSRELKGMGHEVRIVGPDANALCVIQTPFYRLIDLEFFGHKRIERKILEFAPDAIHLATEGPLGWAARGICLKQRLAFTTFYHTRFPDYIAKHAPRFLRPLVSEAVFVLLRRFHASSQALMVATPSIEADLLARNFRTSVRCSYGVDTNLFKPYGKDLKVYENLPRPILLNVGRIAAEKNLDAFLDLNIPGSKVLIGDGPELDMLRRKYPEAHFLGGMEGEMLARHYAAADLFVFPSKTDTFGLVLLEACASGLRIAAYPVPGPKDIFASEKSKAFAALDENLGNAVNCALALPDDPRIAHDFASGFSWRASAEQFLLHQALIRPVIQAVPGKPAPLPSSCGRG